MRLTWQGDPPERLLTECFHIETGFHPGQREIIERLVQGKRVLAIQRTGWGKSLCYQIASLYYPYLTIIFSPLKALMRDQCQRCNNVYNIPSAIVSSDFSEEENQVTLERAAAGELKLLFIAPERLDNMLWQRYVLLMRISMIVIDEAHCISTWGHDFRPHYRRLVRLLNAIPENTPVLGLTATANKRVELDILQQMGKDVQVVRGTMQRPNLWLNVVRLNGDWEKLCYLGEVLSYRLDVGLIYTATQSSAMMVAMFLSLMGMKTDYYHAGREESIRKKVEQNLMANQYNVVCSTTALGMGIDKADIRFVIHYHVPASPIHYYQEIGRAGRDGNVGWCILLYDPADVAIHERLSRNEKPAEEQYYTVLSLLRAQSSGLREHDIMLTTGLSEIAVRNIVMDLEEQRFINYDSVKRRYIASATASLTDSSKNSPDSSCLCIDFSTYKTVQLQKRRELETMQQYAHGGSCYMGYLIACLGGQINYKCGTCGYCRTENFPPVSVPKRMSSAVTSFLEEKFLPGIEMRQTEADGLLHEAGWSLAYHKGTRFGELVSISKYKGAGPFALGLVLRAVEVVRMCYPVQILDGVVSVPPTGGSMLVEVFARQVAERLGINYFPVLTKVRFTKKQKSLTNRVQKMLNVEGVFAVLDAEKIKEHTLLLIDDIYDSGFTLCEAGKTLMRAGARTVYPLTITRTTHSDDQ